MGRPHPAQAECLKLATSVNNLAVSCESESAVEDFTGIIEVSTNGRMDAPDHPSG